MHKFKVFGDSHSRYFEVNEKVKFHAPWVKKYDVEVFKIPASSVIGLGRKRSKLNVAGSIKDKLACDGYNVFGFGQVDLELGYYYKKIIKREEVELGRFADYLVEVYAEFIKSLRLPADLICIKGLNLTVLKYQPFALAYVKRIILENIDNESEIANADKFLKANMESFSERNAATLEFNKKLRLKCKEEGWKYFDINEYLSDFTPGKGIADRYIPSGFDHHLVDSIEIRKMHLSEMVKAI